MLFYVWLLVCGVFSLGHGQNIAKLKLSGGKNSNEGNVEVFLDGEWRFICDDSWDMRDAKVACRQMGFTKALNYTRKSVFTVDRNVSYWLDDVQCWGHEEDLVLCWHRGKGNHNCKNMKEVAGVVCTSEKENQITKPVPFHQAGTFEVRLSGDRVDSFVSSGFLEVKTADHWATVCSDAWTEQNSFVACGNLGYPGFDKNGTIPEFDPDYPDRYHAYMLNCTGIESTLYECPASSHKKCKRPVYLNCKRSKFIKGNRFNIESLESHNLRLRAGSSHHEGRVEILHAGRWGTICDDMWNITSANVACRQLGFGTAYEATHYANFGQGSGKIWLDEVQCSGRKTEVHNCTHLGWGEGDCGHPEDAGVRCHFPYSEERQHIRVVGGPNKYIGRVEVLTDGKWGAICGIGWGVREAEVVCRQTGLGYAKRGFTTSKYGLERQLNMYKVKCSGDELEIKHCIHLGKNVGQCRYYDMASVECSQTAPDLVMDYRELTKTIQTETKVLTELTCAHDEGCLASSADHYMHYSDYYYRTLLRFTSRFWNRGTDNFLPDVRKSDWEWHQCHAHYHSMERFSDYDITDLSSGKRVGEGHKASFCLEDSKCENGVSKVFNCTDGGDQGVSINCADNYKHNIDCQWIDVTDLKEGDYRLRVILNPLRNVVESDYSNNIVSCDIHYGNGRVNVTRDCKTDTCSKMSHGGTADGACCKLPFMYKGKEYKHCTTDGMPDGQTLWCSATSTYDKDKLWGIC